LDYRQLITNMSPAIYQSLKTAVERGRWPDGKVLTPEQRETTLQAVIAWGEQHLPPEQRVGYIDKGKKAGRAGIAPAERPLVWKD
jgi:uncharacterized protein YeaC (DUF1315 family)